MQAYHATHVLMYVLFFLIPLVGWAYSSAAGFPIVLFGVLPFAGLCAGGQRAGRAHQAMA